MVRTASPRGGIGVSLASRRTLIWAAARPIEAGQLILPHRGPSRNHARSLLFSVREPIRRRADGRSPIPLSEVAAYVKQNIGTFCAITSASPASRLTTYARGWIPTYFVSPLPFN